MNNTRRKAIAKLQERIEELKTQVEELMEEERDYLDDMPFNLQDSKQANISWEAIDSFGYTINSLLDAFDNLEEARK